MKKNLEKYLSVLMAGMLAFSPAMSAPVFAEDEEEEETDISDTASSNIYTVSVTYEDGEGSTTCEYSQFETEDEELDSTVVTLAENEFVREGYEFAGWEAEDGTIYEEGEEVTLFFDAENCAEAVFTAVWEESLSIHTGAAYTVSYSYDVEYNAGFENEEGETASIYEACQFYWNTSDLESKTITLAENTFERDGYEFAGWLSEEGDIYQEGDEYTLYFEDRDASATFTAQWSEIETEETKDLSDGGKISISKKSYTYTGEEITPSIKVTYDGETLEEGVDYEVSYENNVEVGTATITVTGIGDYTGTLTKTFKITAASFSKAKVSLSGTSFSYTGKAIKPSVTVTFNGEKLKEGEDYTVQYSNNTNTGTGKITVKGKGNFSGSLSKTFTIKAASKSVSKTQSPSKSTKTTKK